MSTRRGIVMLACLGVAGLIAVGMSELPKGSSTGGVGASARLTSRQRSALLAGSPPALMALHDQSGELLDGSSLALHARLASLRGYPLVINKWASWCGPCKNELSAFQHVSVLYGRRVAFLGLDSLDPNRAEAVLFMRSFPLSYPSYYDRSGQLGEQITDSPSMPVTVFIGRDGRKFIHQGQYPNVAKLEQDVQHYALDA